MLSEGVVAVSAVDNDVLRLLFDIFTIFSSLARHFKVFPHTL